MRIVKPKLFVCMVLIAVAGCSSDEEEPPARTEPPPAVTTEPPPARPVPVAHALDRAALRRLPADVAAIEAKGRPVASTEWDGFVGTVAAYYAEEHGVPLFDPPAEFKRLFETVARQGLTILVFDDSQRRRYASKLARLRPSARVLQTFYDEFTEDPIPDAGEGVRDWLRVLRESLARARGDTVVVVAMLD